jgi:large subunit ribosomal protein L17
MNHGKKFNHLGRKTGHRRALLSNMASSLILHKRIETTTAKAKALRKYIEPLLTKSKNDTTHSRRVVFSYLLDKYAVTELFREVAPKIADRPGGYTRIIKTGFRLGDNADMCFIELVDYNELMTKDSSTSSTGAKKKRTRRAGKKAVEATAETPKVEAKKEETPKAEAKKEEAPKAEAKKEEAPKAEAKKEEAPKEEAPKEEPKKDDSKADDKAE